MHNKRVCDIKIAIERLRYFCSLQEKCQFDVIQKMLEWGLPEISRNNILELLIEEKYIDEERYSRSFCRGKFRIKKWGKIKISNELIKKKISEAFITKGLEEISESEYQQELDKQYLKKKHTSKEKNSFVKKNKIAQYLINKGYESNLVWDKLKE